MKRHNNFDIGLVIFVALYNLILIGYSIIWLFTNKLDCLKIDLFCNLNKDNILLHLSYFFFAGIIGGSFYCLRALYQRLSDAYTPQTIKKAEELPDPTLVFNIRIWFFWYVYRPLQGGILSIILICLFSQGLIGINGTDQKSMESLFFQVGIGFLVGFGTHEVINKIEELIKVLFSKSPQRPSNSIDKIKENDEIKQ